MAQLIDLDLPQGIQLRLSSVVNDDKAFWVSFRTGLFLQTLIGVIGAILLGFGASHLSFGMSESNRQTASVLFPIMAIQMLLDTVGSTFMAPMYAKGVLKQFTTSNALIPTFGVIITIPLVLILKSPTAVCIAMVIESLVSGSYKLVSLVKFHSWSVCFPAFSKIHAKEILSLSLRSYPGNLSSRIAGSIDKVLVGVLSTEALTYYNVASRISSSIAQIFGAANGLAVPEMLNTASNDPSSFSEILKRNLRFTTWLYSFTIIIACSFGEVILGAWLHKAYAGFAWISVLMGIYWYLEMNFGLITVTFFAYKRAHLLLPFALWNALVTTFCTTLFAKSLGLLGVGLMNALIDLAQIVPICLLLTRKVLPKESTTLFIRYLAFPMLLSASLSVAVVFLLRWLMVWVNPLPLLVLIPLCWVAFPIVFIKLKWMPLPSKLSEKIGGYNKLAWLVR